MNDDAAHREEHIGEHLQNADWKETTGASPHVPRKYDTAPFSICKMGNRPYASPF
jgi:hypothetical protein